MRTRVFFAVALVCAATLALWAGWEWNSSSSEMACSKTGGIWARGSGVCMDAKWSAVVEPAPEQCEVVSRGRRLFIGTVDCMRERPKKDIRGYWVSDHEGSAYFRTLAEAKAAGDLDRATSLLIDPAETPGLLVYSSPPRRRVFKIHFIGTQADAPGVYGTGTNAGAVLVQKLIELNEVTE
jgi:hypothetical protein